MLQWYYERKTNLQFECGGNKVLSTKIIISIFGTLTIVLTIAIIAISRKWNKVKFFLYLYFDILDKNDGDEDLTNKFYDIFISYRYVTFVNAN